MTNKIDLYKRKCAPCEGGVDALGKKQALVLLDKLSKGWKLSNDNKKIIKEFKFKNHYELIAMINLIAWISHREDHHPEILFSYSDLTVTYYTYAIDGLSDNDFICAAKIDNSVRL